MERGNGKAKLKKVRELPKLLPNRKRDSDQSTHFVFCDKNSGLAQFQGTSPLDDMNCTIERMASMLAMQCLVRGSEPTDFAILVPAEQMLANKLASRAKELLEEGRAVANPADLSPRQKEILHSVMSNLANKEIASKLNITVRTVKFHISTLLNKFGAENRAELSRRASGFLRTTLHMDQAADLESQLDSEMRRKLGPIAVNSASRASARPRMRFAQRVLSA